MPPTTTESSFKTTDGCSIAYTLRAAEGPNRIALIHSLGLNRSIWDAVSEKLEGKASVLAYDCRGHGRSSRVPGPFTMERFAQDLAELMSHVGWTSSVVAGCSMGGGVTQTFGGLYPERAAALGLIDTTAWYGVEGPAQWRQRAATAEANGLEAMVEAQTARWFGDAFRLGQPEIVNAAARVLVANDLACYRAACEMLGDSDLRHYLPALHMPVAVVVGEEDYATPIAFAQQLHEAIAGSTLTILPGRHITPIECPDQISSQLLTLFEQASGRQATAN